MTKRLAILVLATLLALPALAAESPQRRSASGMPKGTFASSCTCALSGGTDLTCYCANLQAKLFRTSLDVRACPGPKDIKNCDGVLTCTASTTSSCPVKD